MFGAGLLFALGLGISGMTQPAKVVGFLDITGDWKPELAFVMGGAIAVHLIAYRLVPRMSKPLFEPKFGIPSRRDIDGRLLGGALLFGAGWGLGGYCPGPGIVSLVSMTWAPLVFVGAMVLGMVLMNLVDRARTQSVQAAPREGSNSAA
ncbi:MAG: YeeE/YedE family protein [Deltaproteobacteria bacterium]|nr:MAG: YeeE/YedE family protein [Deltaproteobacteria bacterium]